MSRPLLAIARLAPPTLALLGVLAAPAAAQDLSAGGVGQGASLVFVPPFHGAVTVDLGLDARFDTVLGDLSPLESTAPSLGVGYLHYLDGHGRHALGGALRLAYSAPIGHDFARQSGYLAVDLRLESRWRFINDHFAHLTVAPFVDLGVIQPRQPLDPGGDAPLPHLAAGVALGPGALVFGDPYVFTELVTHIGVGATRIDGAWHYALTGGIRLRFDFGLRGRDLLPCEYDPMNHGPCP